MAETSGLPREFPERTVGMLDWVTVLHQGERFYVVNQYDNGNLALRRVKDGYRKGVQIVVKPSDVKPHNCQWCEGSEVGIELKKLWEKLSNG